MRCPKCHYIGFEPAPRCKNCGYDLAFGSEDADAKAPDTETAEARLEILDEQIRETVIQAPVVPVAAVPAPAPVAPPSGPAAVVQAIERAPDPPPPQTLELPLFVQTLSDADSAPAYLALGSDLELPGTSIQDLTPDDEPLVRLPPAPRTPLSVRRPTPAPGRVRERYHRDLLDPEPEADAPAGGMWIGAPAHEPEADPVVLENAARPESLAEPVSAFRRVEAALVDMIFLGSINVAVIWLTLQRCGLTVAQIGLLPVWPVAAFLFVVNAGYLLLFTAVHGQTIGKMAAGIRVVGGSADTLDYDPVTLKQAMLRALLTFPSVLALGVGFVPALLGSHLALHDRFTHTRVVRA